MAGIYIHIPFCKQACSYCNFHFSTKLGNKAVVLEAIHKEITLRSNYLKGERINSVYFGGGTPSLLEKKELEEILNTLRKNFILNEDIEYCLEANPDDISEPFLEWLKDSPINRLSIGVQSFQEADLLFMNRAHSKDEAINAIRDAQKFGFSNISIDLIFGSQTTTDEMWKQNLEIFFDLGVDHLSAYSSTIEEKTALMHRVRNGNVNELDEERNYRQYLILQEYIKKHGFEQYELSNYCKNGAYSKHNVSYWEGKKYLGIGPSAHSYNGISRQWNVSNNTIYVKNLNTDVPFYDLEKLSESDLYHEWLITSLRTKWGGQISKVKEYFSDEINRHFHRQLQYLNVDVVELNNDRIKVKSDHLFQSDEVVRQLMLNE